MQASISSSFVQWSRCTPTGTDAAARRGQRGGGERLTPDRTERARAGGQEHRAARALGGEHDRARGLERVGRDRRDGARRRGRAGRCRVASIASARPVPRRRPACPRRRRCRRTRRTACRPRRGSASVGRSTETMPGSSWPSTSARRMPSPCTATSCDVIPPLAITQAGLGLQRRLDHLGHGLRHLAREKSSPPPSSLRLVYSRTSPSRERARRPARRPPATSSALTSSSISISPQRSCAAATCRDRQADVRADDDQAVALPARHLGQRRPLVQPGQRAHERRPGAVEQLRPLARAARTTASRSS